MEEDEAEEGEAEDMEGQWFYQAQEELKDKNIWNTLAVRKTEDVLKHRPKMILH